MNVLLLEYDVLAEIFYNIEYTKPIYIKLIQKVEEFQNIDPVHAPAVQVGQEEYRVTDLLLN